LTFLLHRCHNPGILRIYLRPNSLQTSECASTINFQRADKLYFALRSKYLIRCVLAKDD
jgi:hypothetical protein